MHSNSFNELLQAKAHHEHKAAVHKERYLHHVKMIRLAQLKLDEVAEREREKQPCSTHSTQPK
jgi:hypothetical protein